MLGFVDSGKDMVSLASNGSMRCFFLLIRSIFSSTKFYIAKCGSVHGAVTAHSWLQYPINITMLTQ